VLVIYGGSTVATIIDVAKKVGVSRTTISRFLNHQGPINIETAERIQKVIEELNYTPNFFAKGMRGSKSKTIGILIPDYTNLYYSELFQGIDSFAREKGYMTLVTNTDTNSQTEFEHIEDMVNHQVDGIILCSYNRVKKDIDYLSKIAEKIPVVVMDPLIKSEPISYVVTDGCKGTIEGVQYLIKKGRKRIGYVKGLNKVFVTKERFRGYKKALENSGIDFDSDLVYEGDFSVQSGFEAAKYLLENDRKIDAIMTATDMMAIGVIKYLNSAKIKIPDEINVIGFDNIALCDLIEPTLSTIAQPIIELGKTAAKIIIDNNENGTNEKKQIVMETKLIIRKSSDD
jgi:DNA-binding LacI/PurR family transcriptional regulator